MIKSLGDLISIPNIILAVSSFLIIGFSKQIIEDHTSSMKKYNCIIATLFDLIRFRYTTKDAIDRIIDDSNYHVMTEEFKYSLSIGCYDALESIIVVDYLEEKYRKKSIFHSFLDFTSPYTAGFSTLVSGAFFLSLIAVASTFSLHKIITLNDATYDLTKHSWVFSVTSIIFSSIMAIVLIGIINCYSKKHFKTKHILLTTIKANIAKYQETYKKYKINNKFVLRVVELTESQ